jgi:hypothetical protein
MNKSIKVRRFVSTQETELVTGQPMTDAEVLNYLEHSGEYLDWEETEVITHYEIVERYA